MILQSVNYNYQFWASYSHENYMFDIISKLVNKVKKIYIVFVGAGVSQISQGMKLFSGLHSWNLHIMCLYFCFLQSINILYTMFIPINLVLV